MKTNNTVGKAGSGNQRPQRNRPAPDVRDNLDSRKNEEQESRGDDITHNKKAHRNRAPKHR